MGCSRHLLYKGPGLLPGKAKRLFIGHQLVHDSPEAFSIMNLQTATTGLKPLSLPEPLVIGTENDGDIPYGSL